MRRVCTMALLLAASCARDNPRYQSSEASSGAVEVTTSSAGTFESTSGPDSGSTSASEPSSSSSGSRPLRCEGTVVLREPFDAVPTVSDGWWVDAPDSIDVTISNGALHVGFDQSAGYWVMGSAEPLPSRASLGFEVLRAPDPDHPIQVLLSLNDGAQLLQFALALGSLDISWWDQQQRQATPATAQGPIAFDPMLHRWLRLSFDTQAHQAIGEVSSDGVAWTTALSADISPLDLNETRVQFSIGAWAPVPGTDVAVIDNAFMCIE